MHEFFRGWRRKVGCATLLMACALSIGWMRSLSLEDAARFSLSNRRHLLRSVHGRMEWHSWIERVTDPPMPAWLSQSNWQPSWAIASISDRKARWRQERLEYAPRPVPTDLAHARIYKPETRQLLSYVVPYWLVVPVLMISSAYLILRVPRKRDSGPQHSEVD